MGIRQKSNAKELFNIAKDDNINSAINYDCESSSTELETLKNRLNPFIEKVISFDIAKLNPSLDRDKLTASLAAKIIDFVAMEH
jgi:formiminoglutamase